MQSISSFLEEIRGSNTPQNWHFEPFAEYDHEMDFMIYLREECSYVADRMSTFLTVLWHPYEPRIVGVKVKGCHFLFGHLRDLLELKETDFMPLVKVVRAAFMMGFAEKLIIGVEPQRQAQLNEMFEQAQAVTADVNLSPDEWRKAA